MASEGLWLSLMVSDTDPSRSRVKKTLILVPKKVVALATRRNRLRRMIREVTRKDPFFLRKDSFFQFKVISPAPQDPGLAEIRDLIERLKTETQAC